MPVVEDMEVGTSESSDEVTGVGPAGAPRQMGCVEVPTEHTVTTYEVCYLGQALRIARDAGAHVYTCYCRVRPPKTNPNTNTPWEPRRRRSRGPLAELEWIGGIGQPWTSQVGGAN